MMSMRESTEAILKSWRYGQIQAERLCAGLLSIDGYTSIDPQCPLGGRDGMKDLICQYGKTSYVAAVTFPPTEQTFKNITTKFDHDLAGVRSNEVDGIVFFVNKHISPSQRAALQRRAVKQKAKVEIYHLERIRALLDAPKGYGFRVEYLRVPMTQEEQLDFWQITKDTMAEALSRQSETFVNLTNRIEDLMSTHATVLDMIAEREGAEVRRKAKTNHVSLPPVVLPPSSGLAPEVLFLIHRAVYIDFPDSRHVGRYRTVQNWIGSVGSTLKNAAFVPPPPQDVPKLTEQLLSGWNHSYKKLCTLSDKTKTRAIADFHHGYLSIHPFLDGNGRVARLLLMQQVADLLGPNKMVLLKERAAYFNALQKAHTGDPSAIRRLIRQSIISIIMK